jgi:hypothetical protein
MKRQSSRRPVQNSLFHTDSIFSTTGFIQQ